MQTEKDFFDLLKNRFNRKMNEMFGEDASCSIFKGEIIFSFGQFAGSYYFKIPEYKEFNNEVASNIMKLVEEEFNNFNS
jgi:hypothetical protein